MKHHKEICALLAEIMVYRSIGNLDTVRSLWADLKEYAQNNEDELQQVLDVYELIVTFELVKTGIIAPL